MVILFVLNSVSYNINTINLNNMFYKTRLADPMANTTYTIGACSFFASGPLTSMLLIILLARFVPSCAQPPPCVHRCRLQSMLINLLFLCRSCCGRFCSTPIFIKNQRPSQLRSKPHKIQFIGIVPHKKTKCQKTINHL